jgi:hypothetical protein
LDAAVGFGVESVVVVVAVEVVRMSLRSWMLKLGGGVG